MSATVIIPTYNERDNIAPLVERLLEYGEVSVLVVDDASPDGTGAVADAVTAQHPGRVEVLHRTSNRGFGRSYVDGIAQGVHQDVELICQMDADLSHPASVIPSMLDKLETSGAGVVLGSRYVPGGSTAEEWKWYRKALSAWANFYVNLILRLGVKDATAGFKAWQADTLRAIDVASIRSNGYSFQVEMNYRTIKKGITIAEVPIRFEERTKGASKMSLKVQLESAAMPWKLLLGRQV